MQRSPAEHGLGNGDDLVWILDDAAWDELMSLTDGAAGPCFQCGACTASCPWGLVREQTFSVRGLIRRAQMGIFDPSDPVWLCTACGECEPTCPKEVPIPVVIRSLREMAWRRGVAAPGLPSMLWSIYWNGNPWSQPPSNREGWWVGQEIPYFDPEAHEVLLYIGCTSSYDRRAQRIARAMSRVLEASGAAFGVLGEGEPCCGESALQVGQVPYFREIAEQTTAVLLGSGAQEMVVISPHCYDVFRNHYPDLEGALEVQHSSQYLATLISSEELRFDRELGERVTFQDPCFLGRKNGEFDAPRTILRAIPGVEMVEMAECREDALCCGGGGGRMWLETPLGERFSDLRVQQAANQAATVIATACPFCVSCLEDSVKATRMEGMRVMDLAEIAILALG